MSIVVTDQLVFLVTAIAIVFTGIGSMTYSKNLIKTIMSFQAVVVGANLALFSSGIGPQNAIISDTFLMFSILAGASVEAVGIAIVVTVFRKYGTLNPAEIRRLRG